MKPTSSITLVQQFLVRVAAARVLILFGFHAIVFAVCYASATLVRFDFTIPTDYQGILKTTLPVVVGLQLFVGFLFGFYRGWWRYVGIADVLRLVAGIATATGVLGGVWYAAQYFDIHTGVASSSRGALLIDAAFALLVLFGARLVVRVSRDRLRPAGDTVASKKVLIIGAGDAGETLARELEHRRQLGMTVVGFLDDHRAKWGSVIRGIRVLGPISRAAEIADAKGIDEALIAIPSASGKRIREIINHLAAAGLQFKTIPGIDHLVSGRVQVTQLRAVNVEDLLRRECVDIPGDPVRRMFHGKRVIVTGAGGTIGSELATQIVGFEPESLVLLERSEYALYEVRKRLTREHPETATRLVNALVDIQQTETVRRVLADARPHIVIHAAAHKHVPLGEENPLEYVRNNALATRSLAETCEEAGVENFVLISTDKAINPTSVMGASKRAAEILLLDLVHRRRTMQAAAVRFGNVIGSSGSVIPLFMEQIAAGGPITVTHPDVTRYFLRTSEAVSLVLQAATLGERGDVFMLDMGEPVKIVDLAHDLIRLSNHGDDIQIVFTGLRPGEKLYEEIRLHGESVRPTAHPQIVVTAAPQPDARVVARWIEESAMACARGGDGAQQLRKLIPEYKSPAFDAGQTPQIEIRRPVAPMPVIDTMRDTPIATSP